MEASKNPDRLNYSTKAKQLLDKIEDSNYFGLANKGGSGVSRSEIFLFAMALGVETNTPTEIKNIYAGGLVLDKSIDSKTRSVMYAQFISKLKDPENELDEIIKKNEVYKLAEQYANTGFQYLEEYFDTKKPELLALNLFLELDEQYESLNINIK
ncbi:MAG: hypothetical protein GYA02_01125 [Clostridiaceae bacterium]|jgi:hypothetical protein|nr:hypothetical protein [Clostridiaceae bacterium]